MSTNIEQRAQLDARLSSDTLDLIIDSISTFGLTEQGVQALKTNWPQFRFIVCEEGDLGDKEPFWQGANYGIHLMAASFGCATLTHQIENAKGLVIELLDVE